MKSLSVNSIENCNQREKGLRSIEFEWKYFEVYLIVKTCLVVGEIQITSTCDRFNTL